MLACLLFIKIPLWWSIFLLILAGRWMYLQLYRARIASGSKQNMEKQAGTGDEYILPLPEKQSLVQVVFIIYTYPARKKAKDGDESFPPDNKLKVHILCDKTIRESLMN